MTIGCPLVSVVIPTYNQAHFLKEALVSVQNQTNNNWEVIVINNYSDDNTEEIVENFCDSRIRLVNFKNNGVIAASRNLGIKLARGEFVAFLDSDDSWDPEKLERCIEKLLSGYDLVCHGVVFQWDNGKKKNVVCHSDKLASYDALLYRGNRFLTSATVVRKDILMQVDCFNEDPQYVTVEDYDLWLRVTKVAKQKVGYIQQLLGVYRIHQNNASNSGMRHFEAECALLDAHFKLESRRNLSIAIKQRKRYALLYYSTAERLKETKNFRKALFYYLRAIMNNPFLMEAYYESLLLMMRFQNFVYK